jgi:phage tail protein X
MRWKKRRLTRGEALISNAPQNALRDAPQDEAVFVSKLSRSRLDWRGGQADQRTMAKKYITSQGDMWDAVAHTQMGSCSHTGLLMAANSTAALLQYYIFPAGVELSIPDIPSTMPTALPVWRQPK